MNDSELLQRLREREPEAVELLFQQYLPSVWRLVSTRVDGDIHLAEDLVNETMLALLRSLSNDSAAEIQTLSGWLHTVAIRKVQDHYRAVARVRHLVEVTADQQGNAARANVDPGDAQLARERRREIRDVVESLPDQFRIALEWKYIEGLSVAVIAKRLGATEKAAESILYRARKAFRERAGLRDLVPVIKQASSDDSSGDRRLTLPISKRGLCGGQAE